MKYLKQLTEYSNEMYLLYSKFISEQEWGNMEIANEYLNKYHISKNDYLNIWRPIENLIFKNKNAGLPDMVFQNEFSLLATGGGVLFDQKDFEVLQSCILEMKDENIVIIQNCIGRESHVPPLMMKYPSDITWDEIMSGNFISTVLFEMFANDYFVYSESGNWGRYSANDYEMPLDIIGFKPEYERVFREHFTLSQEELSEVKEWLPPKYREVTRSR